MGIIEFLFKKQIDAQVKKAFGTLATHQLPGGYFYVGSNPMMSNALGGFPVYNQSDTTANVNDGYSSEDVYSIVRRIAKTITMIPQKVYKIVDDEKFKEYEFEISKKDFSPRAIVKQQLLKSKALELAPPDNDYQLLLDSPNPSYSKTEFREGLHTFLLLTGNTYIHTPLLEFGVNAGKPTELWLSPPQFTSIQVSSTWPRKVDYYRLQIAELITIPVEEMIHIRYFNPKYNYVGNELLGFSPLTAGSKVLTRQEAETDYSVNAFQNSGISGIVNNESARAEDIETGVLGKMKSDFYSEAAGVQNARKLLFMAGKIGYQQVGLGPVDMGVLQSEVRTFKKLCNLYGVSDLLFNNDGKGQGIGGKTDIVYKDLYTNAALPGAYAERDAYNKYLTPKFNLKGVKYYVDCDITGINELQDDFKEMAAIYSTLPVMNPFLIAKAFGWDTDTIEDKWFIKNGYQTVEDAVAGAVQPLPVETEKGN